MLDLNYLPTSRQTDLYRDVAEQGRMQHFRSQSKSGDYRCNVKSRKEKSRKGNHQYKENRAVLIEAVGHDLAMIVAGVNDSDLQEPWDRPEADQPQPLSPDNSQRFEHRPGPSDMGNDLLF